MTTHEAILILLASGLLAGVLSLRDKRWFRNVLLTLSIAPALFLAVEGATEVVTCDEIYMISEVTNIKDSGGRPWEYFHTSIAITGNIINALRTLRPLTDLQATILAKAVHWLLGVSCLAGIFWTISRTWIPKNLFAEYFVLYFYSALLLPTNILSMKAANYDMLAMLLGIWGLIFSFIGCEKVKQINLLRAREVANPDQWWRSVFREALWPDRGLTLFGVILTTLAAQEKLIAAPFLTMAIVLAGVTRLRRRQQIDWWLPIQVGICILVVLLVLALTHGVVAIWGPRNLLPLKSLLSHFDMLLRAVGIREAGLPTLGGLFLVSITCAAILIWRLLEAKNRLGLVIGFAFPLLLMVALVIGAIGFYKVESYVHPIYAIPNGSFVPQDEMNREIIHFLSRTRLEHIINKTASAYSIFATAVPSAFGLLAAFVFGSLIWRREPRVTGSLVGFQVMGIVSLGMPLVYVLTNTAVGTRYFNIWLFTAVLLLGILGSRLLAFIARPRIRHLAVAIFCFLLLFELLPFRPVVGAFWPCWARASGLQMARTAEPGKVLPVWGGWGEEAMIVGRQLHKMAIAGQLPSKSFRLFTAYVGDWLAPDQTIETRFVEMVPYLSLSFTENDYYVVNRAAVVQGRFRLPVNEKPVWTVDYRGVTLIWVFRGSDIKPVYYAKGCPFVPAAGFMWMLDEQLPENFTSDSPSAPNASTLELYEDKKLLGPAHAYHEAIQALGSGRYSHWKQRLYFSTSDNSNPNTNKHEYAFRVGDLVLRVGGPG